MTRLPVATKRPRSKRSTPMSNGTAATSPTALSGGVARRFSITRARWASIWDGWTVELEELTRASSDTVIAYIREKGRSETGVVMDEQHAELYVVRRDKIVRRVAFSDPAEAIPAVRELGL